MFLDSEIDTIEFSPVAEIQSCRVSRRLEDQFEVAGQAAVTVAHQKTVRFELNFRAQLR
jgi:hypothetical protein